MDASQVPVDDPEVQAETADLLSQIRPWARDNVNSFHVGADVKGQVADPIMVGGRLYFDRSAIPTEVLSPNNIDFDTLGVGLFGQWNPVDKLGIALSFNQQFWVPRTVENSVFDVTLDPEQRLETRYFYPSSNGRYSGRYTRLGISVRGRFGGKGPMW